MTRPRSQLISLEATPYYHCISRCVRRAFLCGDDSYTGKNFDHRKPWILARLSLLGEVFAIDIAAYAVMSNHYHLVLHVDKERAQQWQKERVIDQWFRLYKGPALVHRYLQGELTSQAEHDQVDTIVATWRERLCSISWFMACLNEYIARRANQEDSCKGRFWEARFKSQALLDETALLSCMAYVDLNPVRAGIAKDLPSSDYTSVQARYRQLKRLPESGQPVPCLMPFNEREKQQQGFTGLPYTLKDYLDLVDWTGRIIRADKRGSISKRATSLLTSLGLSEAQWQVLALEIQQQSINMLNGLDRLSALERRKTKIAA
jgi:REP element-mobilizing transposase RayT